MFKMVKDLVWAFDAEWVPDPKAGRLLYGLAEDVPDEQVMQEMWKQGGATDENPTPYLKTVLCRMVSIAAVQRHRHKDGRVTLHLLSLPRNPGAEARSTGAGKTSETTGVSSEDAGRPWQGAGDPPEEAGGPSEDSGESSAEAGSPSEDTGMASEETAPEASSGEADLIERFLSALGDRKPQLVGYNSMGADVRILVQRAVVLGLRCPKFASRPNKPWEGVDYFARGGDFHLDLKDYATPGWGQGSPSLHELAVLSGIPGKMETSGDQVPAMWLEGRLEDIVAYNECDALTTYLVWLRMAHFAGHFTGEAYAREQEEVWQLLQREAGQKPHLARFAEVWVQLSGPKGSGAMPAAL